ncbi:Crp/Fnr family transcriptional regulator [Indioceanicola profundi]|uniref:Crp/Fnr family transcriptional regulator n=1 Tax=Indioceanicola profundi TaxID=2220096 RepID=UPI000E6AC3A1|nr:Crp/Fnr family transcriptional regulator [Indioceanicola profundi]
MSELHPASLDRIDLLQALSPAERANLARQCSWRHFHPHEQIIDRSSESRDVCLIVEGRVRVVNYSLSGREITFDDIDAGGWLGELSAIDNEPRSASIVALTETMVAFMSPRLFQETVTSHPDVAWLVMRRLARIIRQSTGRIMDLSTLGANNRVHAEILRLAKAGKRIGNTAEIVPIPIHSDIASRVSTTRETVARVFSDLARDELVERRGNALVVLDFERLEEMVEDVRGD